MLSAHTLLIIAIVTGATLLGALVVIAISRRTSLFRRIPGCASSSQPDASMETGIAVGVGIGVALGMVMDNVALGIPIGIAIGIAIGSAQKSRRHDE